MVETLKKIGQYIESNRLLLPKERVIVGVSGGMDSVVLLDVLAKLGYHCVVAHCNFHLRADESDRDAHFVSNLAKKYGFQLKVIDFDTVRYAKSRKISIEMAARELRYDWFHQLAEETDSQAIVVAHHADDSTETLLLNLIRGTGLKGLTGIEPKNGIIVRPLLTCSRSEIEKYAQENKLEYVFDSTNATNDYSRNKIRNQILPLMADINPSIKQTLYNNIVRLRGAWKIYEQKIIEIQKNITFSKDNIFYINIEKLKEQADPKTVLYEIIQKFQFNGSIIEDIMEGLDNNAGTQYFSETHCLLKDRNYMIIKEIELKRNLEYLIEENEGKIIEPLDLEFIKKKNDKNFFVSKSKEKIHIDADKIKYPLTLRTWRDGDVFYPFGMKQRKKVSNFFIDEKLNRFQKENTWLLLSEGKIVWIVGLRLDNRFGIGNDTQNILEIIYYA